IVKVERAIRGNCQLRKVLAEEWELKRQCEVSIAIVSIHTSRGASSRQCCSPAFTDRVRVAGRQRNTYRQVHWCAFVAAIVELPQRQSSRSVSERNLDVHGLQRAGRFRDHAFQRSRLPAVGEGQLVK